MAALKLQMKEFQQDRVYEFNHVFDESDTQQAVFQVL